MNLLETYIAKADIYCILEIIKEKVNESQITRMKTVNYKYYLIIRFLIFMSSMNYVNFEFKKSN